MDHCSELKRLFPAQKSIPVICAHRGGKENVPENSMAAFQQSASNGIHCMENDIQLTKDNEIIVLHDDTVDRTSNGKGPVREMTLKDLQKLDFGSWYHTKFKKERVPTLNKFLNVCNGVPLIEIKKYNNYSEKLESILIQQLNSCGRLYTSIIHSFDLDVLQRLHQLDNNLLLGYLIEELPANIPEWIGGIHPSKELLTKDNLAEWRGQSLWVAAWTYVNPTEFSNPLLHPDILITDIPLQAKKILK
jgi:glycerophosphoryl diester phosphodiesterase